MRATVFGLLLTLLASQSLGMVYGPRLNEAEWRTELSPFICKLWQPIPYFGSAVFEVRAGGQLGFHLESGNNPMRAGQASLVVKAPLWAPERGETNLGYVPVAERSQPVKLDRRLANRLLTELHSGMSPVFTRRSWYENNVSIQVALSSVNFRDAYGQYQHCLAQLLPVNWQQIARTRVNFAVGSADLSAEAQRKLDLIVRYVKADRSVDGFYVDGHTDNAGRQLANLELSQKRAEAVTSYLVRHGIDPSQITTRYHGEQYPAVSNNSAANRACCSGHSVCN